MEITFIKLLVIHIGIWAQVACNTYNASGYTFEKNVYSPTKLTDCSAKLDDGKIIDLTSLDNKANPR